MSFTLQHMRHNYAVAEGMRSEMAAKGINNLTKALSVT
jgi:hypothetical protein